MLTEIDANLPAQCDGLTDGQTEETTALVPVVANPSNPELVAERFLEHRAASVREEVAGNVVLNQGIVACFDNPEKRTRLLAALLRANVISRDEAEAGRKDIKNKSLMSMLKKIGQHSGVILHPKILPYLQPGYSVLYLVALLFEALGGNLEAVERMHEMIAGLDGPVTRKWLRAQIDKLTGKAASDGASAQPDAVKADAAPISVLLLTPNGPSITELTKEKKPERDCEAVRLGRAVAGNAIMLVATPFGDLLRMSSILKLWGFKRFSRIVLLDVPSGPDIADVPALGLCERGQLKLAARLGDWPDVKDPVALADELTSGIEGRRVHLFAETQTEGWDALVGDENWSREKPPS